MSIRELRARLDRLERSVGKTKLQGRRLAVEFPIDPELAKALVDDLDRLSDIEIAHLSERLGTGNWDDLTPEEIALRERIAQNAKTINVPSSYGHKEFLNDSETLQALNEDKEKLLLGQEEFFIGNLEDVEAEKAQLTARMEAFEYTPEGQARSRLEKLLRKSGWKSPTEYEEIERLMNQYHEPLYPTDFFSHKWWPSLEELREDAKRDRRIAEEKRSA